MKAHITPQRGLSLLICLLAAAGCEKATDETAIAAVTTAMAETAVAPAAREATTLPEAAAAPDETAAPAVPIEVEATAAPVLADRRPPVPSPSIAHAEHLAAEPTVAVPAAPRAQEPEPALAAATLDVSTLATRLRKTKAIGLRTKLAVKNESDDLLEQFRAYHARHGSATLVELRRSYDSLFSKLQSLLEEADPNLARDIDRSRAAIWTFLADPLRFGASASNAPRRDAPPS
jgi:hypothetical protein